MSESREYPIDAKIVMTGYDTARYAVVRADSVLPLTLEMTGYEAFARGVQTRPVECQIVVPEGGLRRTVAVATLYDELRQQLGVSSNAQLSSQRDSLRLMLAERSSRSIAPDISQLEFIFAEGYGLYGEPRVEPSQVTLYGPAESLEAIESLPTVASKVVNISASGAYHIGLSPVWEAYPDVHPSCKEVEIYLPVEQYVERTYKVPVEVEGADTTLRYRIYPEEVTLHVWVAMRDLQRDASFKVSINYDDILQHESHLRPRLVEFPNYIRPRSIEPEEVQCVVIR